MASVKNTPKDALVIAEILKEVGVSDYEPRILNQMLEFTYRYVTGIVDDAYILSKYAKKNLIDIDDVKLSVKIQCDRSFTSPPLREDLMLIASQRNAMPIPLIKSTSGPRLPPDRYSLTSCNYRLRPQSKNVAVKQRILPPNSRLSINDLAQHTSTSIAKLAMNNKSGGTISVVNKAGAPTLPILPRSINNNKSYPTPIIKFPEAQRSVPDTPPVLNSNIASSMPTSQIIMPPINSIPPMPEQGDKRKREEDSDNYDI